MIRCMGGRAVFFSCNREEPTKKDRAIAYNDGVLAGAVAGETGIPGLRLDFNAGLRLEVPEGDWHVRVSDGVSGQVYFDGDVAGVQLQSLEQFYVPWLVEVWLEG